MARIDKILSKATDFVGVPLERGALVAPPGSPLYRNVGGGSGYTAAQLALGAMRSKRDGDDLTGEASKFPKEFGLIAEGADEVFYLKTHKLTGAATDTLARWPKEEVAVTFVAKGKGMRNPAVLIQFADDTEVLAFGEKKWGIESFQ